MKQLEVPFLPFLDRESSMQEVSEKLDRLELHAIDTAPWPAFHYKPLANFTVAHSTDCLFVKFYVEEGAIRAVHRNTNDPVYKDSCVEFFIAFNQEKAYYNLEFNSLGTCLMAFGTGKNNRQFLPEGIINEIKRLANVSVGGESGEDEPMVKWELTLAIPAEVFCFHQFESLNDQDCRVNFYKCGDDLPMPHYLSWNKINAKQPDFHLPEYFGELQFL